MPFRLCQAACIESLARAPHLLQVHLKEVTEETAAHLPGAVARAAPEAVQVRGVVLPCLQSWLPLQTCSLIARVLRDQQTPTPAPAVTQCWPVRPVQAPEPMLGATARAWAVRKWNEVRVQAGVLSHGGLGAVAGGWPMPQPGCCCCMGSVAANLRHVPTSRPALAPLQGVDSVFKPVVAALSSRNL